MMLHNAPQRTSKLHEALTPVKAKFSAHDTRRVCAYIFSLGVGDLVGIVYGLLNIRSPAPPVVPFVGLFGMLLGEHIMPMGKRHMAGQRLCRR